VVVWLEGLASQKLPQDPVQLAASYRFGSQEGVWKDTLRGLGGQGRQGGADVELDPDAVSRDQLELALGTRRRSSGWRPGCGAWCEQVTRRHQGSRRCTSCSTAIIN
jgi:hypothetical protein